MDGIRYLNSLAQWREKDQFDLNNISQLLALFGNPQNRVKSLHVAGTNGKGSVSATLASILGASGAKVGLATSPHLSNINERVIIDGLPVDDYCLNRFALVIARMCDAKGLKLSFFEAITVISFLVFAESSLDWMVIEVGLGGRLDATNVLYKPEASVIVTIDYDHERVLGTELAQIASEKAGIIREESLLVSGRISGEAFDVISKVANLKNCRHVAFGKDFRCSVSKGSNAEYIYSDRWGRSIDIKPTLRGAHQLDNMALAVAVASVLGFDPASCKRGVEQVVWPGRIELLKIADRDILIDCAHNAAGIESLINYLKLQNIYEISIGFGVLGTKNWTRMIDKLSPFVSEWNVLRPESASAVEPESVLAYLSRNGISGNDFGSDYSGFLDNQLKRVESRSGKMLLLTGSIYMIGKLRALLLLESKPIWRRENSAAPIFSERSDGRIA